MNMRMDKIYTEVIDRSIFAGMLQYNANAIMYLFPNSA